MKVAVLSGGVGGARFLRGLLGVVDPGNVSIVGNIADDIEVLGLRVSPDLDSILYTLTGLADDERGWGRAGETWQALESVAQLGGESWFRLGDRDIGLHLVRTELLRNGMPLSDATDASRDVLGLEGAASARDGRSGANVPGDARRDLPVPDVVRGAWTSRRGRRGALCGSARGRACARRHRGDRRRGRDSASPRAIRTSRSGRSSRSPQIRAALERRSVPCVAVSPLIGGRAVKGPADRMLARLAGGTTPAHVASCYEGLIDVLVIDESDEASGPVPGLKQTAVTKTLMSDESAARQLAAVARPLRRCARVRVAILGGTGSFGRALAARLVAAREDDDVVIGSRDEERARETAAELGGAGITGATNEQAVAGADLVVLAVNADAALDTARSLAGALGTTPLLSVASAIEFHKGVGMLPDPDASSLAERVQAVVRAPVVAGLHSIAAANLDGGRAR